MAPTAHAAARGKPPIVTASSASVIETLAASRREFVAFVERRVRDRALAEEIVHDALVKSAERGDEIRESAVGWFYRVLRNAIVDHARRRAAQDRQLTALATEPAHDDELRQVCDCLGKIARTLKPEYADAIQRVDIEGLAVNEYATAAGITASNAGVRLHRARQALRTQVARACGVCALHGCVDCTCKHAALHCES